MFCYLLLTFGSYFWVLTIINYFKFVVGHTSACFEKLDLILIYHGKFFALLQFLEDIKSLLYHLVTVTEIGFSFIVSINVEIPYAE